MSVYDGALQDLIDELGQLPGIGPRSAQRIAFHVLAAPKEDIERSASALSAVKERPVLRGVRERLRVRAVPRLCGPAGCAR